MKYLVFLTLLFTAAANATIYECNINGSKTFQSKPCPGSKELRQQVEQSKAQQARREQVKANYEAREAKRIKPRVGMTMREVEQSTWGYPSKTNKTTTTNNVFEQWVYRDSRSTRYLHFTNGKLTSISE